MNIIPFLTCLGATGINTGVAVLGLYDFSSGDSNLVYNQLYQSGQHYISGTPYNNALPMIFNGSGSQPSGNLSGNYFYQVSDKFTGDFSAVISLFYSGCNYTGNSCQLLASTSAVSGALLGITPSNRIFVQTPDYSSTISKEIGVGDFAYISVLGGRFVNFGLFSMTDNVLYNKNYDEGSSLISVTDLFFGGTLNFQSNLTGYSGKIKELYLFSGSLSQDSIENCITASFVTGFSNVPLQYTYNSTQLTGSLWQNVQNVLVTGEMQVISAYPEVGGGTGYVYFDSGVTGLVTTNQALIPLSQNIVNTGYYSGLSFSFNTLQQMSGFLFDFYFTQGLSSGDIVEIYTYSTFNTNIGYQLSNLIYPNKSGIQLYGNGLAETSGVDYIVAFNSLLIGFDSIDVLQYDLYPITYTMPYSSGYIQTGTTGANFVNITGVSGFSLSGFQSDIYLNGQKLPSGINFSVSGATLTVSGNDLQDFNDPSGDFLEIKFIPQYSGFLRNLTTVTGSQSYVSGISGFSEMVFWNGLRLFNGLDYFKYPRCRSCSGVYDDPHFSFNIYNTASDNVGFFV